MPRSCYAAAFAWWFAEPVAVAGPGEGAQLHPFGVEGPGVGTELSQQLLLLAVKPALTTSLLWRLVKAAVFVGHT